MLLATAALALWIIIFLLPWRPWRVTEQWDVSGTQIETSLQDITVLIPARNEQEVIGRSLQAVVNQGDDLSIIVVDDQSTDHTYEKVVPFKPRVTVLKSKPLPSHWSGKLWALEQGCEYAETPLLLLLDADVELAPGTVHGLRKHMEDRHADMVSLMAQPPLNSWWERLLMPAFIYYFKLLYPFSLANSSSKYVAAAAGGCILIRRQVLKQIGGFKTIRTALIDDCQLAGEVKKAGFSCWLGLTHSAKSIRPYTGIFEIWNMVSRTAFTQLKRSIWWLLFCSAIMCLAYLVPVIALGLKQPLLWIGASAWLVMFITYLPVLNYYKLSWLWALLLPFIACLYLCMTWTSAFRYWGGERIRWRGRTTFADDGQQTS